MTCLPLYSSPASSFTLVETRLVLVYCRLPTDQLKHFETFSITLRCVRLKPRPAQNVPKLGQDMSNTNSTVTANAVDGKVSRRAISKHYAPGVDFLFVLSE